MLRTEKVSKWINAAHSCSSVILESLKIMCSLVQILQQILQKVECLSFILLVSFLMDRIIASERGDKMNYFKLNVIQSNI